ncbi:hypothetical protein FZC79_12025 [Rossellomorea vietnamensis]|uniref:Uncharacterized protein n=2 Tax=Rossellomorea TaxID=2837508 RepID=A0A5D4KEI3_9BACI|nr:MULTISPECIES: hypothetical protein [Rossellomorea]TYR75135.1 hypothetical protein FZC79_12025 [Rossellomorea vietnamensis]TYS79892.1 hypothetical protein FZC80_09680 [Rossellomorea aquimaris]
MTADQKRTVFLLMLVSTLIGVTIRLLDVTRSSHELVSFYSLDILILMIIMVLSGTGLLLVRSKKYQ